MRVPKEVRITLKGKGVPGTLENIVASPKATWIEFLVANDIEVEPDSTSTHISTPKGRSAVTQPIWDTLKKYKNQKSMVARVQDCPLREVHHVPRQRRASSEPESLTRRTERDRRPVVRFSPENPFSPSKRQKVNQPLPEGKYKSILSPKHHRPSHWSQSMDSSPRYQQESNAYQPRLLRSATPPPARPRRNVFFEDEKPQPRLRRSASSQDLSTDYFIDCDSSSSDDEEVFPRTTFGRNSWDGYGSYKTKFLQEMKRARGEEIWELKNVLENIIGTRRGLTAEDYLTLTRNYVVTHALNVRI